jgi:hypothetical protein
MKQILSLLLGLGLIASAPLCFSGAELELAVIEKISSNASGAIHIKLDKPISSACSSKKILLLPTAEGKIDPLLSRAMFAYTTGEKISIYGTGQCQGEFEIVSSISRT